MLLKLVPQLHAAASCTRSCAATSAVSSESRARPRAVMATCTHASAPLRLTPVKLSADPAHTASLDDTMPPL